MQGEPLCSGLQSGLLAGLGKVDHAFGTRQSPIPNPKDKAGLVLLNQVHSNRILVVRSESEAAEAKVNHYDGVLTSLKGKGLVVRTADCVPLLLYAQSKKGTGIAGALHVGWRSLLSGIVSNAFERLRSGYDAVPERTWAAIGPSISPKHYAVRSDLVEAFEGFLGAYDLNKANYFLGRNELLFFDLKGLVRSVLHKEGVPIEQVDDLGLCTFECEDKFHSHRRNQTKKRMGHRIALL